MLTLSDILSRAVQVEWFEAVALMRELTDRLAGTDSSAIIPEMHQVALHQSGQVDVRGGTTVSDPVQRLGQMFQSLLGRSDPPVQLRLLIAQSTAPGQGYESVGAFSEALGFFERPDRTAVLRDLYTRASVAPPLITPLPSNAAEVGTSAKASDKKDQGSRRRPRLLIAAAVAALVLVAGAVGLSLAGGSDGGSSLSGVSALTARATKGVGTAVASAVSALGARAGSSKPAGEAPKTAEARVAPPPAAAKKRRPTPVAPPTTPLQRASLSAFDLTPVPPLPSNGSNGHSVSSLAVSVPNPQDDAIYSGDSAGVTPPVAVRPQLPRELPPGVKLDDLNRVEVIILPNGLVESVKLIGRRPNVHDGMLLSAVKAWEFKPALKQGVPVKYRKTIWLAH